MYCTNCGHKNNDSAKFCASCGHALETGSHEILIEANNNRVDGPNENREKFEAVMENVHATFGGQDGAKLSELVAQSMGAKNSAGLVFNVLCSPGFFIIIPISKDKSHLALFGLILGGGGLAAGAVAGLTVLTEKLQLNKAKALMKEENPFYNALVFDSKELELEVRESGGGGLLGFILEEKQTWVLISGVATYKNIDYRIGARFGFEGHVSALGNSEKNFLHKISRAMKINTPEISRGKNVKDFL